MSVWKAYNNYSINFCLINCPFWLARNMLIKLQLSLKPCIFSQNNSFWHAPNSIFLHCRMTLLTCVSISSSICILLAEIFSTMVGILAIWDTLGCLVCLCFSRCEYPWQPGSPWHRMQWHFFPTEDTWLMRPCCGLHNHHSCPVALGHLFSQRELPVTRKANATLCIPAINEFVQQAFLNCLSVSSSPHFIYNNEAMSFMVEKIRYSPMVG